MKVKSLSRVQLFATPWTAAYQVPLSMGFFRQEYWSGVPLPSPGKCIGKYKKLLLFFLFNFFKRHNCLIIKQYIMKFIIHIVE